MMRVPPLTRKQLMEEVSRNKSFGGFLVKLRIAESKSLGGLSTHVNVFLPPQEGKRPVLFYLAGLTCNEDTAAWKGCLLGPAASAGIALVFPDTSPRGSNIPGETDSWDFGVGAGFYVDATKPPYSSYYRMESFVTEELPRLLTDMFPASLNLAKIAITGHSMGGHGALSLYLKHPNKFTSASAFAPICNPTKCPWGVKAFEGYLEGGLEEGKKHDSVELIKLQPSTRPIHILIDTGSADKFLAEKQLLPENLQAAASAKGLTNSQIAVQMHEGYDHSYYFVSSFAASHVEFHSKFLFANN